jgi:hypothetical protein
MVNKVKFNDTVEIHIYEKDDPPINIKKNKWNIWYEKLEVYIFSLLILLFIIYLLI